MSFIGPRRTLLSGSATKPTWSYDFARTQAIPPGSTYSGPSARWGTNGAGVLVPLASNIAPFDYAAGGTPLGYRSEEQRANGIRNNTMVGTVAGSPGTPPNNWANNGAAGTTFSVVGTGIENGIDYVDIRWNGTPTTTGGTRLGFELATSLAALTGQFWTASAFVRVTAGSLNNIGQVFLVLQERTNAGVSIITDTGPDFKASLGASFYRASYGVALSGGATVANAIPEFNFGVTSGSAIDVTFRIGLPQMEQGAFATSPIKTSGSTATRAQDSLLLPLTSMMGWSSMQGGGFVFDFMMEGLVASGQQRLFSIDDTTSNNQVCLVARQMTGGGAGRVEYFGSAGGPPQWDAYLGATPLAALTPYRMAVGWSTSRAVVALNGALLGAPVTGSFALPSGLSYLRLGTSGGNLLNGTIARARYYAGARSDAFWQQVSR